MTAAVAAAANAEASILPSSPMSTTPERSAKSPPSAARTSGVAPRRVAAARSARRTSVSFIGAGSEGRGGPSRPAVPRAVGGGDEEEIARLAQDEAVPRPARNDTGLSATETEAPLATRLVEDDVERAGEEVEKLVAPGCISHSSAWKSAGSAPCFAPITRSPPPVTSCRKTSGVQATGSARPSSRRCTIVAKGSKPARRPRSRRALSAGGARNQASIGPRSAYSSAPQTRMIRPWMTTTMSRVSLGMSNDSSDPPW